MPLFTANPLVSFLLVWPLALWIFIAWYRGREINTPVNFLRRSEDELSNVPVFYSFVASNIVIGGTIIALATGGASFGITFYLIPITYLLAFLIYYWYIVKNIYCIEFPKNRTGFFIHDLSAKIAQQTGKKSILEPLFAFIIVTYHIFLFSFEIFLTSRILSATFFPEIPIAFYYLTTFFIITSLLCVYYGGVKGLFASDKLQFWFAVGFVVLFIYLNYAGSVEKPESIIPEVNRDMVVLLLLFTINVLFSPYINFNNLYLAENTDSKRVKSYFSFPFSSGSFILALIFAGLIFAGNFNKSAGISWNYFAETHIVWKMFFLSGVSAILISSVDSLMLSALYNLHGTAIFKKLFASLGGGKNNSDGISLKVIKLIIFPLYIIPYGIILILYQRQPEVLPLIVSASSALIIFSPLLIMLTYLAKKNALIKISNRKILIYGILCILAFIVALIKPFGKSMEINGLLLFISIIISFVFSINSLNGEKS